MIENVLQGLGLTDKEIAIYLALLPVGSAPASVLGARTSINRSTAQYICQQLAKKGIIKALEKNHTFIYTPESPDKLLYLIDLEKKKLSAKEDQVHRIIGDLKAMINPQAILPKVRFFEGVDGLIEMFNDVLIENKPLYGVAKLDDSVDENVMKFIQKEYVPKRKKLKNPTFGIFNDVEMTREYRKNDQAMNRTSLLLPLADFPFEACLHIYGSKVAFYSYKKGDLSGVIIQNENIFKTTFSTFKASWNYARSLPINQQYQDLQLK